MSKASEYMEAWNNYRKKKALYWKPSLSFLKKVEVSNEGCLWFTRGEMCLKPHEALALAAWIQDVFSDE